MVVGVLRLVVYIPENHSLKGKRGVLRKIKAQVFAKSVIVLGEVHGNVTASEKVDIRDNGSVEGDLVSPRIAIAEGAHFKGSIDMQRKGAPQPVQAKPAAGQPQQQQAPAQAGAPQTQRVGV